jgi:hypothetical protein
LSAHFGALSLHPKIPFPAALDAERDPGASAPEIPTLNRRISGFSDGAIYFGLSFGIPRFGRRRQLFATGIAALLSRPNCARNSGFPYQDR